MLRNVASEPVNKLFNELYSKGRCLIEHLNGILKARWMSLKGLRIQVKKKEDFAKVNKHIVVCLILHNLLIDWNDNWRTKKVDVKDRDRDTSHLKDTQSGEDLRLRIQKNLLDWHYAKSGFN